ncbi:hypothetical protein HRbin26_01075 [bacterium HR26]|nr:hypothetical protein HRbin26_01075 [bacterium HR26]
MAETQLYRIRHLGQVPSRWADVVVAESPGPGGMRESILALEPEEAVALCREGWALAIANVRPGVYPILTGAELLVSSSGTWRVVIGSEYGLAEGEVRLWRAMLLGHREQEVLAKVFLEGSQARWELWQGETLLAESQLRPVEPERCWREVLALARAVLAPDVDEPDTLDEPS